VEQKPGIGSMMPWLPPRHERPHNGGEHDELKVEAVDHFTPFLRGEMKK